MRRVLIPFLILAIILSVPNASQVSNSQFRDVSQNRSISNNILLSDAGSNGSILDSEQYMSRALNGYQLGIYNTYADSTHNGAIDLTSYQVSGWTLYAVDVDATAITATAERVSLNVNKNTYMEIENDTSGTDLTTDALYQAFYNLPHDGKLENYSITGLTAYYLPGTLGYAFLVIRSDYASSSTNETSWISPFTQGASDVVISHDVSADNAILNASTYYYAVIDGTGMVGQKIVSTWYYNQIFWRAEDSSTTPTGYHLWDDNTWYLYQGIGQKEADLNYTYTPWNKTSGAALTYSSAEAVSLTNTTHGLTGTSWSFSSPNNITQVSFQSNQSVEIDYDITLWYKRTGTASTNWNSQTPGPNISWNATAIVSYPVLSGTLEQFLNYSVQADWTPTALYDGNTPVVGTHTKYSTTVHCTDMTDGTWTLSSDAPNYVGNIDLTGVTDGKVSILTDMDIDAAIEDGVGTPMTGGTTNLTVLQTGSSVYTPAEIAASGGSASFIWDIDSTTLGNSTHSIEVWWTNGLEAGYNITQVFVYYPTTLTEDDSVINAYAEDSFAIGVDFDQDFPVRGLDISLAAVIFSFDGGVNTSLNDQTGGRWTATVSTAGKADGIYQLFVYAEGYALENQSLMITVNLVFETLPLNWSWSNGNNIAYLESTNLSISYQFANGSKIAGASVNVTFQSQTYPMAYNPISGNYWIELHGLNFTGVPGNFTLSVNALKAGHEVQSTDLIWLYVQSASGEVFVVEYSPDLDILYIETMTISVTYNFSSSPIENTTVTVTFDGANLRNLTYNPISQKWEIILLGIDYLGIQTINVTAMSDGYVTRFELQTFIVQEDTPILSNSWIDSVATTDYDTNVPLSITLTMSNGTPINDATVSFTAFSTLFTPTSIIGGVYTFSVVPNATRGVESFTVTVIRTGYETSQMSLSLTVEATTLLTLSHSSDEYEEWNITIEAEYLDAVYLTPITGAMVNITLDGALYILQYVDGVYAVNITLDMAPSTYTIDAFASAQYAAYATDQSPLEVRDKEILHIVIEFAPPTVVAGEFMEVRATLWSNRTETTVSGIEIHFEISIKFSNGTVIHYTDASQTDTTNSEGVATYGFDVPEGQIDTLSAKASYIGSRERWSTETTETTGVEISILALVMSFLTSDIGLMIILSIAIVGIVAAGYNRGVKPKKKSAKRGLESQLQMFKDLETVRHFMAVYLDRGTCVFYHPFTDERIQPDLISGFIAAITSVYGEIKGDGVRGTLEEIQYHGLRLNSYSGQYVIGILILEGEMTTLLRERLQFFVELFENQYDHDLDGWTGLIDCFDPEWVVATLNSAFNYAWHLPHRFGPTQKVTKMDAKILDYIGAVRDERSEFYIKNLLSPLAEMLDKTEPEVIDRLLLLQDRGIIVPIGIQTILQRQGLALVNGSDAHVAQPPTTVDEPDSEEAQPETVEELEFEEFAEEVIEEPLEELVEEPEPDPMEAFVQDVESLLVAKKDEEKKDDELDEFAKELRAKIGDEETED